MRARTGRALETTEGARNMARRVRITAKRVLIAQALIVGGLAVVLMAREMPGLMREVRIWRMVGFRAGSRYPR